MRARSVLTFLIALLFTEATSVFLSPATAIAQQAVYANYITDSSADFNYAYRTVDADRTNYGYVSTLSQLLDTTYIRVGFPVSGIAGDVINIELRGLGQTLGSQLLDNTTIRLYDSLGNNVANATGSGALQLTILSSGDSLYGIRYLTNPTDTFRFKEARIEFKNVLAGNYITQFRVFNIFYQQSCPPVLANSVFAYSTGLSYTSNPGNAVDNDQNNYATLNTPISVFVTPAAYLDVAFPQYGNAGEYVGFTIGQETSALNINLLQNITITAYDENGIVVATNAGFSLLNLRRQDNSNKQMLGFVTPPGIYHIARIRITLNPVIGLGEDLDVYNGFHYRIDRPLIVITGPTVACAGNSVTLTATDPLGATNFLWGNGGSGPTITVNTSGIYTVSVTDSFSCTSYSVPVTVTILQPLTVQIAGDTVLCAGSSGILNTTSSYQSYQWSTGATTPQINISTTGQYYVSVTDSNNCTASDTVLVKRNQLSVTPTITNATCSNSANGVISLNVTNGSGNYSYRWGDAQTSATISNLKPGIYPVTVEDNAYNCSFNTAFTVPANNTLTTKASVTNTSDSNKHNGEIKISVIGGSGNYTYAWSNGATVADIANLTAGIYYLVITDNATGCSINDTEAVSDGNNPLNVTATSTPASGYNTPDGSITLTVTSGSGNYSYAWSNGATTPDISNLLPGIYYVMVTDNTTHYIKTLAVPVGYNSGLNVTGVVTNASANMNNGSIVLTVTNGSGNYSYLWSNGATTRDIAGLQPGIYMVNVTDNVTGNMQSATFTVGGGGPAASLTVTQPDCNSNSDGSIAVSIAAGPYAFNWSNGSNAMNQTNLSPGYYTLLITDTTTGYVSLYAATIMPKPQIDLNASPISNTSCPGSYNGSITTAAAGGTQPYSYAWSNGGSTPGINNLGAGQYTVTVTDANGCSNSLTATVTTDSSKLLHAIINTITQASCQGVSDGGATTTTIGGVGPYTYSWSNGGNTAAISNVSAGTYTLTVSDAQGCFASLNATVPYDTANAIALTVDSVIKVNCSSPNSGKIYVHTANGTAPYSYLWSNGSSTEDLTNATLGTYSLTIADARGCKDTLPGIVVPYDIATAFTLTVDSVVKVKCNNGSTGKIYVTPANGSSPYSYLWSNGSTSEDLLNVVAGPYTLMASDARGCRDTLVNVIVPFDTANAFTLSLDSVVNVNCSNASSGKIFVTTKQGTAPYTYLWSNGGTTEDLLNATGGTYTLVAGDGGGCRDTLSATISNMPALTIRPQVTAVQCYGNNNGAISVTVDGGSGNYHYSWNTGNITSQLTDVGAGSYTVTVTDLASGCLAASSVVVSTPDSITLSGNVSNETCAGNDGGITLTAAGGTAPYSYAWNAGNNSGSINDLTAGTYTVVLTDHNNCQKSASFQVAKNDCNNTGNTIIVHNVITPNGDGVNDNLVIEGIQNYPKSQLQIFDKWGDMVYEQSGYNNGWTGTDKNGKQLTGGTYYYILKLNAANMQGGKNDFTGFIMVQR